MKLTLRRKFGIDDATIGELLIDGMFECYTLEDVEREEKIAGVTAIPAGEYPVRLTWSPAFGRNLPLICDVKGFSGVRIHAGNTPAHTEGCVLVGQSFNGPALRNSKVAFDKLYEKLRNTKETITLVVWPLNLEQAQGVKPPEGAPKAEGMRQGSSAYGVNLPKNLESGNG